MLTFFLSEEIATVHIPYGQWPNMVWSALPEKNAQPELASSSGPIQRSHVNLNWATVQPSLAPFLLKLFIGIFSCVLALTGHREDDADSDHDNRGSSEPFIIVLIVRPCAHSCTAARACLVPTGRGAVTKLHSAAPTLSRQLRQSAYCRLPLVVVMVFWHDRQSRFYAEQASSYGSIA